MLILRNQGFHEFVLTILIWSLFNTLMDLSYSAFVSKLFICNDSLILRSCMLDSFASIVPIKPPMITFGMFSCTRRLPFFCHVIFLVLSRSSEHTFFLVLLFLFVSPHNRNLIRKHRGNCLVIVYFCCYMVRFFSFAADVFYFLHLPFQSSFLILDLIFVIHSDLMMLLSVLSVLVYY